MKDPSAAMQTAIHAGLMASSALSVRLGGSWKAYDKVPDPRPDPLIRIGDDQAIGDSNGCADAWEHYATLHIFSRDPSRPRMVVKELMDLALQAVGNDDAPPAPTGFRVHSVSLERSQTFMEDDGVTAHGVATLLYRVTEA